MNAASSTIPTGTEAPMRPPRPRLFDANAQLAQPISEFDPALIRDSAGSNNAGTGDHTEEGGASEAGSIHHAVNGADSATLPKVDPALVVNTSVDSINLSPRRSLRVTRPPRKRPAQARARGNELSEIDMHHVAVMSQILAAACACEDNPRGVAGVADALGRSPQYVMRLLDPTDSESLKSWQIGLLPPSVQREYITRLDQHYRASRRPQPESLESLVKRIDQKLSEGQKLHNLDPEDVHRAVRELENTITFMRLVEASLKSRK